MSLRAAGHVDQPEQQGMSTRPQARSTVTSTTADLACVQWQEEEPYTFQQFHASTSIPYVWGSYCKQYNWPEDERGRNRFANGFEYFAGSWRNENETWMFLAVICSMCSMCSMPSMPSMPSMRSMCSMRSMRPRLHYRLLTLCPAAY